MNIINQAEIDHVHGGLQPPTNVHPGMNARIALRTFPGIGWVVSAAVGGWTFGNWLNENTPIQEWIADGLDSMMN